MGAQSSILLQEEEIQQIQKDSGFNRNQILRLYSRFCHLDKGEKGFLSRNDFLSIPELAINPLADRIVHSFFKNREEINFRRFAEVLSVFRPMAEHEEYMYLNTIDGKLRIAFETYDLDSDGYVNQLELLEMLHNMVGPNISDEQLENIALQTMEEADQDRDALLSFDEFKKALAKVDIAQKMSIRFLD